MRPRRLTALVLTLVALVSCGDGGGTESAGQSASTTGRSSSSTTTPSSTAAPSSTSPASPPTTATTGTTSAGSAAPWAAPPLPARDTSVVLAEWDKSATKGDCPPLAFAALGDGTGGVARAADFGTTSWAVAWDKAGSPGQLPSGESSPTAGRSTFGIAGVGGLPDSTFDWPYRINWSDGSSAGYGVEGGGAFVVDGSTTKWLSYLRLDGHACLYNVWSNLGRNHLEFLLGQLRSVEGHPL